MYGRKPNEDEFYEVGQAELKLCLDLESVLQKQILTATLPKKSDNFANPENHIHMKNGIAFRNSCDEISFVKLTPDELHSRNGRSLLVLLPQLWRSPRVCKLPQRTTRYDSVLEMQTSSVLAGTWIWPISGSSSEGEPVPFQPEASMSERHHGEEPGYIENRFKNHICQIFFM